MDNKLKVLLTVPSVLTVIIVLVNFFGDFNMETYDLLFNLLMVIQIVYLIALIYILVQLWKDSTKSKTTKWTWTLLMAFCLQPITTIVYLWAVEPQRDV